MFFKYKLKAESGVTLIELLVVISIISLLAGGIIMLINPLQKIGKANDAKRKGDMTQIQRALEMYYQDNQKYPANPGPATYKINDGGTKDWGTQWSPYMSMLPKDPLSTNTYIYYSPADGQSYYLYANLQYPVGDQQACFPATGAVCNSISGNGIPSDNVCGGRCNYGVTSPNVSP
jgi:type II secretion system protein G